ncbi:MAG: hypothetical protein APR63_00660 [Desulfuromonas sp. SDB]|nr:MAG: hypothetical protein APR63_00660 [Desulfuromonas sp. SDB]
MKFISQRKIKTGITLFVILTLTSWVLLIPLSYSDQAEILIRWKIGLFNLWKSLASINLWMLAAALLLMLIQQFLSMKRIQAISQAQDISLPFHRAFYFTTGGLFLAAVTPFQSGGIPFQAYLLNQSGSNLSKSLAVITFRGILSGFVLILFLPLIFLKINSLFHSTFVTNLTKYLMVLYSLVIIFAFFATMQNRKSHRFFLRITFCIGNVKIRKIVQKFISKFFIGIRDFLTSYKIFFTRGIRNTLKATLITTAELTVYFLIPPTLALGLTPGENIMGIFLTGIVLSYLLAFSPTPGASGVAELSGLSFSFFWNGPIAALILLWRMTTSYLPSLAGGIALLVFIRSWGIKKQGSSVDYSHPS